MGNSVTAQTLRDRLSVPIIVSPMFLVSGVDLVVASCKAGVIGSLPALNARTSAIFDEWLGQVEAGLHDTPHAAPYAVNLIVHSTNERLDADLDLCVAHQVPIIVASVGSPRNVIDKVHSYGGLVICDAGSIRHARRAAEMGVDGLILLCAGAGGNTGWLNPFAFVAEVRKFYDGPIIVAGAISDGRQLHALEIIGADMAIVGTSFIAARESLANDDYREMLIRSNADDILLTTEVTGIPCNMLRESLERSGFVAHGEGKGFNSGKELETLRAWKDIWSAGHGTGAIEKVESVDDIVRRFVKEYQASHANTPASSPSLSEPTSA
tara:strand:- start:107177 stop:108148 length:972 start_codon:yes stop_codon:yes gene_type:complete